MEQQAVVVLLGGWGVVGRQVVALLLKEYPTALSLVACGRNPTAGRVELLKVIGNGKELPANVTLVEVNVRRPNPLAAAGILDNRKSRPRLVVTCVADHPDDYVALETAAAGVPCLDITRASAEYAQLRTRLAALPTAPAAQGPVIYAATWLAGLSTFGILAAISKLREELSAGPEETAADTEVVSITVCALFQEADSTGPDTASDVDSFAETFMGRRDGKDVPRKGLSNPISVAFPTHPRPAARFKAYELHAPDVATYSATLNAENVTVRLASSSRILIPLMAFIARSPVLSRMPMSWKEALLTKTALPHARHDTFIDVVVRRRSDRQERALRVLISHETGGQSALTTIGVVLLTERIAGLVPGKEPLALGAGVVAVEEFAFPWAAAALERADKLGASIAIVPLSADSGIRT